LSGSRSGQRLRKLESLRALKADPWIGLNLYGFAADPALIK